MKESPERNLAFISSYTQTKNRSCMENAVRMSLVIEKCTPQTSTSIRHQRQPRKTSTYGKTIKTHPPL
jgi:hypothetical protein